MLLTFLLLFLPQVGEESELIQGIKKRYLDQFPNQQIGYAFQNYRWFQATQWRARGHRVTFRGTIVDSKAVEDYRETFRYSFRQNLKAMQLKRYGLNKDKEYLRIEISFLIDAANEFKVTDGHVAVRNKGSSEWHQTKLSDKALLAMIRGIYNQENPYASLIKGLPYK